MDEKEKSRIRTREWRKKFPEKAKESFNKSIKKHPDTPRKVKRRWNEKNKDKKHAQYLAQKIKIPLNEKCELCKINLAQERHHPNYNQPLEVMFLCIKCHRRLHIGN